MIEKRGRFPEMIFVATDETAEASTPRFHKGRVMKFIALIFAATLVAAPAYAGGGGHGPGGPGPGPGPGCGHHGPAPGPGHYGHPPGPAPHGGQPGKGSPPSHGGGSNGF